MRKKEIEINGILLKNYVDLSEAQKKLILKWRNDPKVRNCMLNKQIISLKEHMKFIDGLKNRKDKLYWLAAINKTPIGTVNLYNIIGNSAYWGYYVKPELIGKSYGIVLEYMLLTLAFDYLKLQSLECQSLTANLPVIKLHAMFGFEEVKKNADTLIMRHTGRRWSAQKKELGYLLSNLESRL